MNIKCVLTIIFLVIALSSCGKESADQQASSGTASVASITSTLQGDSGAQWIKGWRDASALLGPRAGAATVVVNGYIYVIGGVNGLDFVRLTEFAKVNDDGSLSPWQETALLNEERGFIDAVAKDGYIYVVGGGNGPNGKNLLRSVERAKVNIDGSLSPWQTLQTGMVMPRRCSKTVIKGNFIYALGGFAGALLDNVERAEILVNGDLGPWTIEEATMTLPRYVNTVKASHGNTYVIGGHDQMKGVGITDVEWAIPGEQGGVKDWKATSHMQVGRYGLASAGHGDSVYAIGGLTGLEYLNSIEVADIQENGELSAWRYTTPLSEPRATFNVVVYKDWIYIIGGTNQDRYLNTVEYASFNDASDIGFMGTAQEAQAYQAKLDQLKAAKPRLPNYGTVKAVQHASMYTYIQIVNDQGMLWLAGPRTELQLNDKIRFSKGVSMSNFYSKELQRSFPQVLFVSKIEKEG
ncbi:hypothetical protein [Kaarinaea lacus]